MPIHPHPLIKHMQTTLPVRMVRTAFKDVTPDGIRAWQTSIEARLAWVELVLRAEHPTSYSAERKPPRGPRDGA